MVVHVGTLEEALALALEEGKEMTGKYPCIGIASENEKVWKIERGSFYVFPSLTIRGSFTTNTIPTAIATVGTPTTKNGTRHPAAGPRNPATACPTAVPAPVAMAMTADAVDLSSAPYRSPRREKTRGKQPPREMPGWTS